MTAYVEKKKFKRELYWVPIIFLTCLCLTSAYERKLSTYVNPGCKQQEQNTTGNSSLVCDDLLLVHITSEGMSDTLHHVWDFSTKPSLMLALTDKQNRLMVDWHAYIQNGGAHSIAFDHVPDYVIAVLIQSIIEFNDTNGMGVLDVTNLSPDYMQEIDVSKMKWTMVQPITNDTNTVLLAVKGVTNHTIDVNGTLVETAPVQISMGAFGGEERDGDLPHLLHSANMSQMDLTLDHLTPRFAHSRYGVSLVVVTSGSGEQRDSLHFETSQQLDDEYAPGVFQMIELLSAGAKEHKFELLDDSNTTTVTHGGYLQWRPIAYTTPERDDSQATKCRHYGVGVARHLSELSDTLPYRLYANDSDVVYQTTNVTFGQPEDGFYRKTGFASWTFVVGIGSPAQETFSSFVTHMVLLGIGLPLVLVILGGVCIFVRRLIQNKDDFFLSQ